MGHVADERDIFTLELYFLKELKRIALQLPPLLNGTSKIHDFYTNIKWRCVKILFIHLLMKESERFYKWFKAGSGGDI